MNELTKIIIRGIAAICAVGTGMLAAATVISTPASLLLLIAAGFAINYSLPLFYRWFSRHWFQDHLDTKALSHHKYIKRLLERDEDLDKIDSKYARNLGLKRAFWTGILSLSLSMSLAVGLYFSLIAVSVNILAPIIAVLMFSALAIVTFMNFNHEIRNVWESRGTVLEAFKKMSFPWKIGLVVFTLSALAAGILVAAMTMDGVTTTLPTVATGLLTPLAAITGPFAWIVFTCVLISTFAMTGYGFFDLTDDKKRSEKKDMLKSFFNSTETYQEDLKTQWVDIRTKIKVATDTFTGTEAQKLELDRLYRQKDAIYHRYTVYQQPCFNFHYKTVTFIVLGVAMAGMLMHVARGYQGLETLFKAKSIGLAHSIATKLATGIMYLSMLAEALFTTTIVTSTMNEEAMLGKQTHQYEDHLKKQQSKSEQAEGYVFQTSRGMHFKFEGLLGLFGAEGGGHGHGTESGQAFADNPDTQPFLGVGMGLRAGFERHGGDHQLVTFKYTPTGRISDIPNREEMLDHVSDDMFFPYNPATL
jgi:hypothetical protein